MIVAIDDTDSPHGMCTTYLASLLVEELREYGKVVNYPILARLNPTVPFKTRGNGAVAIRIITQRGDDVKRHVINLVGSMAELEVPGTDPGIVFLDDDLVSRLRGFYERAVRTLLRIEDAKSLIDSLGIDYYIFKSGRGLIGALAAAGAWDALSDPDTDRTFELIAYRPRSRWGSVREIDEASVWEADRITYPLVWDTVDHTCKKIIFAPHSPDPVLFGIRGDSLGAILKAFRTVRSEAWERYTIFLTNQGTDAHYIKVDSIDEVREYCSYILEGTVTSPPRTIQGGHVFFTLDNRLECAAFEPTKTFRNVIRALMLGDRVRVFGGFKNGTLNLEKIEILSLVEEVTRNPLCECGKRMKSMGKGEGFRCKKCGRRKTEPERVKIERTIECGLYEVVPSARRHITKPLVRERGMGTEVHVTR
ncbi:MAG TPA: DUF1743 domain-containing protein [Candidatus Syntrophoarchaeum butanivorans]|uniref:tRNA(Ile2) 2-agmatinylcytidine synthetase TiaS n=1 Tax=Candidatus Syntropharchaeum butanivorans TaxID=1839936 RepID=A0A1F2P388_9EURY|nr:MAG: tRNA(Ile2) 2-agmatinylcytidine synthetase [Candidatus Syntrophoarchaeum butanivorans]HEC57150.1 DUF1743 domain-containing protein [Candidatus Syntrophoarchaeum butanivorans]